MKSVVVILGLNWSFQSLSSNSRFHATGHKDEDIIHIWPVTMFNFHGVLCDWSRGDLLIQAEPTGVLLCGWYANTGRIKCYFELEQYKPGDSISYPFLQSVCIYIYIFFFIVHRYVHIYLCSLSAVGKNDVSTQRESEPRKKTMIFEPLNPGMSRVSSTPVKQAGEILCLG